MKSTFGKNKTFIIACTAVGAAIFVLMVYEIGWTEIIGIVKQLRWWELAFIVVTFFLYLSTVTLAFRRVLRALGYKVSFKKIYPLQCVKFSIGYITPFMNTGGEPLLIYLLLKRERVPVSQTTSAAIIERVMRMTQALIFIAIGLFVALFTIKMSWWSYPIMLFVFGFLCWALWAYYAKSLDGTGFFEYMIPKMRLSNLKILKHPSASSIIKNIDQTTCKFIRKYPVDFWNAFCFTMGSTAIMVLQYYFIMEFLGINPNMLTVVIVYATINAISLIPIPAGLGTYEVGAAAVFAAQGLKAGTGLVFSLVMRVAYIIATIPGLALLPYFGLTLPQAVEVTNKEMEQQITEKNNGQSRT